MASSEFNVQRKEDTFFITLSFSIPDAKLTTCISWVLDEVIKKYSIPEESINDIHFFKNEQEEQKLISVVIKYCKFDPYQLKAMDKAEQIRFALEFMGENIKSVYYDSKKSTWVAKIADPQYNFDPDEYLCKIDYTMKIYDDIKKVLGFPVNVNFV